MSRETEVKQMAITFCTMYDENGDCGDQGACDLDCWAAREAQRLYNIGYRKASDVAAEICQMLKDDLRGFVNEGFLERLITIYKHKYGLEVEK